jgi:hypothetical protein
MSRTTRAPCRETLLGQAGIQVINVCQQRTGFYVLKFLVLRSFSAVRPGHPSSH